MHGFGLTVQSVNGPHKAVHQVVSIHYCLCSHHELLRDGFEARQGGGRRRGMITHYYVLLLAVSPPISFESNASLL